MWKVRRSSVLKLYGLITLLYGTLLPAPHIARRRGSIMRDIAKRGFEVGVHTYNHIKWQDYVAQSDEAWTRRELTLARDEFAQVFSRQPVMHGAAGWQVNRFVPEQERQKRNQKATKGRGTGPFMPVVAGAVIN